jgi:hypothetical protein
MTEDADTPPGGSSVGRDRRRARLVVAALTALVLAAGCLAPVGGFDASTPAPVGETPATDASPTDRPSETPPPSVADRVSPWGADPVVVAIEADAERSRNVTPLVQSATAYWESNAERYAGYQVEYRVDPDADRPDIVVRFVDEIPDCGGVGDAAGCAPLVRDARQIDRPESIWVRGGLSDESTVLVLQHEFGHALGLTHADAPARIMQAETVLYTRPQPNATERDFPWADGAFTVAIDVEGAPDPATARKQVRHALAYYEDDPPGMPSNLTFETVSNASEADIVVRYAETSACGSGGGSCWTVNGPDPDGDGAIERYEYLAIDLVGVDTEAVGWHVGYWLAHVFGAEDDVEKPPPFRDADYRDRRSEWWE